MVGVFHGFTARRFSDEMGTSCTDPPPDILFIEQRQPLNSLCSYNGRWYREK
jgi:hypothetical protein